MKRGRYRERDRQIDRQSKKQKNDKQKQLILYLILEGEKMCQKDKERGRLNEKYRWIDSWQIARERDKGEVRKEKSASTITL